MCSELNDEEEEEEEDHEVVKKRAKVEKKAKDVRFCA